jgi:hypothetical protein
MSQAVKISDSEYAIVREAANLNRRSLSGQAEHWLRIGRAVERNPEIAYSRIERALRGLLAVDALGGDEQEEFFDRFAVEMRTPTAEEEQFWAERNRQGLGVGLDEENNLVYPPNARRSQQA